MQKYEMIEKGIKEKNIESLRKYVGSIAYTCRDFSDGEFDEVVEYIESQGIKLKDDNLIGEATISSQKKVFEAEDFTKAVYELKRNFCDERIADVKTIGKALYSNKKTTKTMQLNDQAQTSNPKKEKNGTSPKEKSHQQEKIILVLVALVVLVILYAMFTKK